MNGGVLGVTNTPTTSAASGVWTLPEQRRWQQGSVWPIQGFTPTDLFSASEQGVWYDPSDFSTMFQDSAGTTPVTATGQPVGLILDKSGRGNHASQSTTTSRPILGQEAGGQYYLAFDGSDDWLQTGNINFSATDQISVFSGFRKLSDATISFVYELSSNSNTTNGTFSLYPGLNAALTGAGAYPTTTARGTLYDPIRSTLPYAAPTTLTSSHLIEISPASSILRINGSLSSSSTNSLGSGNFASARPLYIGRRGGATSPFNGRIYSLIIRGALTSGTYLTSTEAWVNSKTGAY